ncbi:MAG: hypothetical protein J6X18_00720 [Bacteroidales bacterium]|nr:hypothetical protein [Bacteroidales bacterium]
MEEKIKQCVEEFYREYPTLPRTNRMQLAIEVICERVLNWYDTPEVRDKQPNGDVVFYSTDIPLYDEVEEKLNLKPCTRLLAFLNTELRNHFHYENGEDERTHQVRILLQIAYGDEATIETATKAYQAFC